MEASASANMHSYFIMPELRKRQRHIAMYLTAMLFKQWNTWPQPQSIPPSLAIHSLFSSPTFNHEGGSRPFGAPGVAAPCRGNHPLSKPQD